jgi:CIC family chloride channel protein
LANAFSITFECLNGKRLRSTTLHKPKSLYGKFILWRSSHVGDRQFLLILSAVVGIVGGLLAVAIKTGIHAIHGILTTAIDKTTYNIWYLILPIIGILCSVVLVKYFYKGTFAHGITNVLYSISKRNSIVRIKDALYFMLGSVFTVGLGGSVGMEATLVISGSGLGSNLARTFRLSYPSRILLLGCGAAAALASFFHAPIAGVIFAMEVLMLDLTMASIVPLLVASVTGAIIGRVFLGEDIILDFSQHSPFVVEHVPFFALLGIVAGGVSLYFAWVDQIAEKWGELLGRGWKRTLVMGSIAAFLIFLFPPLFGEGYGIIGTLLYGNSGALIDNSIFNLFDESQLLFIMFLISIILIKAFAVAFTLGAGGIGGYFAPSLFIGGVSGYLVAHMINMLGILPIYLPEDNFTLVGMAGAMGGIFYAPLSAVFLIAEITRGYDLIVPLMLVSTISYLIVHKLEPHSLFTRRLAKRGELITHHKDRAVLSMLSLQKVIETDFKSIHPDASFRDFLKDAVAQSKRNIFPVLDEDYRLVSIVLLDDVRPLIFKQEQYDSLIVRELMREPPALINATDSMTTVLKKFDQTAAWNLPVVNKEGTYLGFISKSKLLSAYRSTLVTLSED